jgi:predicted tellurium resistance membrane protein TerC
MLDGQKARKIKRILQAAGKIAARSRRGQAALSGMRATARVFGRILHQLWLEVTGFTFLALAGIGALAGMREYGKYQAGHASGPGRLMLAICFTASFAWFGLSSFWRVNRKKAKAKG